MVGAKTNHDHDYYGRQAAYAMKIGEKLQNMGFRVNYDLRNEKIGYKIREHTIAKIPYLVIIGDREVEEGSVAVKGFRWCD